ncbi:MAG: YcxB family protein [Ruminococcus sp.]|nr:YcxB family protein [Ruminococcus sp.]
MEENYELKKEYTIPYDLFREAYRDYQKLYVFTKSRIKTVLFAVLALAVLIIGTTVFDDSGVKVKYIFYLLFMGLSALSYKSWNDPNKMRDSLVKSVQALGEPVYSIGIGGGHVDIWTVSDDSSTDVETDEPAEEIDDPLPEKTRLTVTEKFQLHEYENYFLIVPDETMLYVLPKKGFSESELQTVRAIAG